MLIHTYKLEKYITKKIIPQIILSPEFTLKGSFKRKIPYVTDIDIVNYVNPDIDKTNIIPAILKLIDSIKDNNQIMLLYITCGTDNRFKINSDKDIPQLKKILTKTELAQLDKCTDIFCINEFLRPMYKLRWEIPDIIAGQMNKRNQIITFESVINSGSILSIKYFITIKSIPIGIDVIIYYDKIDSVKIYADASERSFAASTHNKDYYYMLFPLKYYFRFDKKITSELNTIIDKKFGLHKQLMVRIDTYHLLHAFKKLNIGTATAIVLYIVKGIESYIPDLAKSNTLELIKKTAINNTPETKIIEWDIQLGVLYDEILSLANAECKDYFEHIIKLIPPEYKDKINYVTNI